MVRMSFTGLGYSSATCFFNLISEVLNEAAGLMHLTDAPCPFGAPAAAFEMVAPI